MFCLKKTQSNTVDLVHFEAKNIGLKGRRLVLTLLASTPHHSSGRILFLQNVWKLEKLFMCYLKDLKDRYILIPAYTEPFSG